MVLNQLSVTYKHIVGTRQDYNREKPVYDTYNTKENINTRDALL